MTPISRRAFLWQLGVTAAVSSSWRLAEAWSLEAGSLAPAITATSAAPLYPPMDLSYFDTPITPAPSDIRFAYAAITWGGHDLEAIADIAAAGYPGIQLRSNILPDYAKRPSALKDELARHHLTFVALSSGNVNIDGVEAEEIATHVSHAQFLRDCGGLYLQCIDTRPKRLLASEDYQRLGRLLTEIGKRTADLGIPLGYHNHMNSMGERPEEVDRILEAADPHYVKLELDIAHYQQGGGDPLQAITRYADRLLFMHIKDVESRVGSTPPYRFVELGRGRVDVKGAFAALHDVKFRGWAVVELDAVPDNARTPKESALINRKYLEDVIGLRVDRT
jgi:inosose dehydratase